MSGNEWDDNNDDGNSNANEPKGLRAQLERVLAQLKAEQEKTTTLEATNRQNTITNLINAKGLNPKIAGLVPGTVEATDEKLGAWLDEHSELFPKSATGATGATSTTTTTDVSTQITHAPGEGTDHTDRMGAAVALGLPPEQVRNLETAIDAATSPEELDKVLGMNRSVRFA